MKHTGVFKDNEKCNSDHHPSARADAGYAIPCPHDNLPDLKCSSSFGVQQHQTTLTDTLCICQSKLPIGHCNFSYEGGPSPKTKEHIP